MSFKCPCCGAPLALVEDAAEGDEVRANPEFAVSIPAEAWRDHYRRVGTPSRNKGGRPRRIGPAPWELQGISKTLYYRRLRRQKESGK